MMPIKYSVIIPTLNEVSRIRSCILALRAMDPAVEIIIADGGSTDGTLMEAHQAQAQIESCEAGRGTQCHQGALAAQHDILVFLHVDTRLASDAFIQIEELFSRPESQIATFRLKFDHPHWILKFYAFFMQFDSPWTRFGDQAIVVRKEFYHQLGGFPRWPLFEDVAFLQQARRQTRIYSLPGPAVTSARKLLENGLVRQNFRNFLLLVQYFFGVSPEVLARKYYSNERNGDS